MPSESQTRKDLLRRVYQPQRAPFLRFIRHILGIELLESFPDTVSRFIDQFTSEHPTLDRRQLQFLGLLRDFLIDRGTVEKRDLIQAPAASAASSRPLRSTNFSPSLISWSPSPHRASSLSLFSPCLLPNSRSLPPTTA